MPIETKNENIESFPINPQEKEIQLQRDFNEFIEDFSKMSNEEKADFLNSMAENDPHFRELFNQLKLFFQGKVMAFDASVGENVESQNQTIEISEEQIKEFVLKGKQELSRIQEAKNEKVRQKVTHLDLILDVSGMYKEYLQDILGNIKAKFMSQKDEKFEKQIKVMEDEIRNISNITEYIDLIGNTDELLDININSLLDKLIVSEEKIQGLGRIDDFFNDPEYVNIGYDNIKRLLANPNVSQKDIEELKLDIFSRIRSFDGLDDDKHRYNSGEAIRTRITSNILNNRELSNDSFIKSSFDFIKKFSDEYKIELYNSINSGKDGLNSLFEKNNFYEALGITDNEAKQSLLNKLYDSLNEGKNNIDDGKLKDLIKKEISGKISYLENQFEKSDNKELIQEKINELKFAIDDKNINKLTENIKIETVYKSFENFVISETLEKKSGLVGKLSKTNSDISLYKDIEGIGAGISDKNFNKISNGTQFLTKQITIMYLSGLVGKLAIMGAGKFINIGETTSIFSGGLTRANFKNIAINSSIEGSAFYLGYTGMNGLDNKKEASEAFDDLNTYDAVRTMLFLGILRTISNTNNLFSIKNIVLDTRNILGTDLVIRGLSDFFTGKEGIEGIDLRNLNNTDYKEVSKLIVNELEFIIPLIIGLRMADRTFSGANLKEIEIIPGENDYLVRFEGIKKEIRILKNNRNSMRNKGRDVSGISRDIQEKKAEYKEMRDNPPDDLLAGEVGNKVIQEGQTNSNKKNDNNHENNQEQGSNKKSTSDEGVNTPDGPESKYIKLKKFSQEAQTGKIDYALNDGNIEGVLNEKGIGDDGKSVGEGLLKKSGFEQGKINEYNEGMFNSEKAEKPYEKEALREMELANEIIYREYLALKKAFIEGKNIQKDFLYLSNNIIPKLKKLFDSDKLRINKRERR